MERPLTALFIDCDSYFASVEQHLDPALRGRPVGVAPVMAESSCCIAASYEAKVFGVKTGTRISEARVLCPGIAIVEAKPPEYLRFHHRVVAAVEDCIHVEAVLSIDEMWAWLPYNLREPAALEAIGRRIKETVAREVSPVIKVSIGASMEARLRAAGIRSVESLCAAGRPALRGAWGVVLGERLWHLLRGEEIPDPVSDRKSIGHSHVLPPESRPPERAWPVLCKLLHKACERLRADALLTGSLSVRLDFPGGPPWSAEAHTVETDSTIALMHLMERLWQERPEPARHLLKVGVVLTRLCAQGNHTPQLFPAGDDGGEDVPSDAGKHQRLDAAVDKLRARYGRGVVYFGSVQESRDAAPMRISFTHIPDPELEQD